LNQRKPNSTVDAPISITDVEALGLSWEDPQVQATVDARQEKIEMEAKVQAITTELSWYTLRLARMSDDLRAANIARDDAKRKAALALERVTSPLDSSCVIVLKQGQIECGTEGKLGLPDTQNAILIKSEVVEAQNNVIKQLGAGSVNTLKDMKEFKRGIHILHWNHKVLDLQTERVEEDTRTFQLLRVTRNLQSSLKEDDAERRANELSTLEAQLEHGRKLHELKLGEVRRSMLRLHKRIREVDVENIKLDEYVQDLAVSTAQREKILAVRGGGAEYDEREFRMQDLVWRRLVETEAQRQKEDIAILKAEVDRLRQRTFPSFAKNYQQKTNLLPPTRF